MLIMILGAVVLYVILYHLLHGPVKRELGGDVTNALFGTDRGFSRVEMHKFVRVASILILVGVGVLITVIILSATTWSH